MLVSRRFSGPPEGGEASVVTPIDKKGEPDAKMIQGGLKDWLKQCIMKCCGMKFIGISGRDKYIKFDNLARNNHTIIQEG